MSLTSAARREFSRDRGERSSEHLQQLTRRPTEDRHFVTDLAAKVSRLFVADLVFQHHHLASRNAVQNGHVHSMSKSSWLWPGDPGAIDDPELVSIQYIACQAPSFITEVSSKHAEMPKPKNHSAGSSNSCIIVSFQLAV
jgi:hypothetical protein